MDQWEEIRQACSALGLVADEGFTVALPGMAAISSVARIRNLGSRNGMLVLRDVEQVRGFSQRLVDARYGYSILEPLSAGEKVSLDSFKEIFRDWGWSGAPKEEPEWMR